MKVQRQFVPASNLQNNCAGSSSAPIPTPSGAKAQSSGGIVAARLKRLLKKSEKQIPRRLKSARDDKYKRLRRSPEGQLYPNNALRRRFQQSVKPCPSKVILSYAANLSYMTLALCGCFLLAATAIANAQEGSTRMAIRDVVAIEGVRENPLIGYGMVIGLNRTGDSQQTLFSVQTLANMLQKMGVDIPASQLSAVTVKNVAAVFLTASLPPFARPGTHIDVTVSSIGDAKSLEGGTLLLAPLYAADGQVYAEAQGAVTLGGYSAGNSGTNAKQVNHPTAGRVPNGALVERDASIDLHKLTQISLLVRDPDFRVSRDISAAINSELGRAMATSVDSGRVELTGLPTDGRSELLARLLNLRVEIHPHARVVISERTGTIVMGKDVRLSAVSILHGDLSIEIVTEYQISQPLPRSKGETVVVPQTRLEAKDDKAKHIELGEGASVEQLVNGLQSIGATARDVVAILQAIKAAGALEADLEVI